MTKKNVRPIKLFLDSGAYSALTLGEKLRKDLAMAKTDEAREKVKAKITLSTINLDDYIAFIKKYARYITVYANLDVIGDADATLRNQNYMEEQGLNPLPVFHKNEDWKFLDYYLENYDYIALGGVAGDKDRQSVLAWLDDCFDRVCDTPDRMPMARMHGFGITSVDAMIRYPWYSVDSTSWVMSGRFGGIMVPRRRNGKWVYDENTWKVDISNQSATATKKGAHFNTLSQMERDEILEYIKEKGFTLGKSDLKVVDPGYKLQFGERWLGQESIDEDDALFDVHEQKIEKADGQLIVETVVEPGLINDYRYRDEANIEYFVDMERELPEWPWAWRRKGVHGFDVKRKAR